MAKMIMIESVVKKSPEMISTKGLPLNLQVKLVRPSFFLQVAHLDNKR